MNNLKTVSPSPHIRAGISTSSIMRDVVIALIPSLICSVFYFGFRALYLTVLSVVFCVGFEFLWQKITKKPVTISDGTAVVTGMLLAFNLPVTVPFWIPLIGAFVAIIIAKQFYGGVGNNFINPALTGRAFLLASWPVLMTRWVMPHKTGFFIDADLVSSATPLAIIKSGEATGELLSLSDMFLGNIGGCIGETSSLALLIGGVYLIARKVISPKIPVSYILTVAVLTYIFPYENMTSVSSMLASILGGGLMLGAIFMATDYVTSPITKKGRLIMGLGCGILTFVIRRFGASPEGVTYAILIMNVATPLIDRWTKPKVYGSLKKGGVK